MNVHSRQPLTRFWSARRVAGPTASEVELQRKNTATFIPFETTSRIKEQLKNSFMKVPSIKKGFERIQKRGCAF